MTKTSEKGKTESLTPGQVMFRMEKRQKEEGYEFGWISHGIRNLKGNALADDAVVTTLAYRGFDLEDMFQFLNSRRGRHLGDMLTGADKRGGFFAEIGSLNAIPYQTPEAMYQDFKEPKNAAHPWAGVKVALKGAFGADADRANNTRAARNSDAVATALKAVMSDMRMVVEATGVDTGDMTDAQVVDAFQSARAALGR